MLSMNTFTILICLCAVFGYLNHRFIKLPAKIGFMVVALTVSLALVVFGRLAPSVEAQARAFVEPIDFNKLLLHGMLGLLLFAGTLHVNLDELLEHKWFVGVVATIGVLFSTVIIGLLSHVVFGWTGVSLSLSACILFGALISPTDPIAVVGILQQVTLPKSLSVRLAGESLFNDGIGVVLFTVLLAGGSHGSVNVGQAVWLFAQETLGGAVIGLILGYAAYRLLKSVDDYPLEILITLALVMGGYALADSLHTSGAIATVMSGLLIGNHGRRFAMSQNTREHLDAFWEFLDEFLNAILFVLIGLEVLALRYHWMELKAGLLAVPIVLIARFVSVGLPVQLFRVFHAFSEKATLILTWAGLRGGISIALALSMPPSAERNTIVAITYTVVVFSIVVQGLTLAKVVRATRT